MSFIFSQQNEVSYAASSSSAVVVVVVVDVTGFEFTSVLELIGSSIALFTCKFDDSEESI